MHPDSFKILIDSFYEIKVNIWITSKNVYENFSDKFRLCHWSIVPWVYPSFGTGMNPPRCTSTCIDTVAYKRFLGS